MGAGRFLAPVESSAQASRRLAFLRSKELRQAFPLASLSYHFRFSRRPLTLLGKQVIGCIQLKRVQAPSRILLGSRWKCSFLDLVDTSLHTDILLFKRYIGCLFPKSRRTHGSYVWLWPCADYCVAASTEYIMIIPCTTVTESGGKRNRVSGGT